MSAHIKAAITTSKDDEYEYFQIKEVTINNQDLVKLAKAIAAQQSVQLTAFGVILLAFCAGFGICWFVFVR